MDYAKIRGVVGQIHVRSSSSANQVQFALLTHLDVIPLVIITALSKESMFNNPVYVQHIQNGISVLAQTSREDDDLVDLAHATEKIVDTGTFDYVDVV